MLRLVMQACCSMQRLHTQPYDLQWALFFQRWTSAPPAVISRKTAVDDVSIRRMQSLSMIGAQCSVIEILRGQDGALYTHKDSDHQIAAWPKQNTHFAANLLICLIVWHSWRSTSTRQNAQNWGVHLTLEEWSTHCTRLIQLDVYGTTWSSYKSKLRN